MKCRIKAFGVSREIIGNRLIDLEVPEGSSIRDLKSDLFARYPALSTLSSVFVAVNNEYAGDTVILQEGDEIALIPPVSGG